jgi:hypothetical protein
MNNTTTKVVGTITEKNTELVSEVFGKEVGKQLESCKDKTFLDILVNSGVFDLTSHQR